MAITTNSSADRALKLIEVALQSGAIKLNGAPGMAQDNGQRDATYLAALLNDLTIAINKL